MNYAEEIMPFKKILINIWLNGDQKSWPIDISLFDCLVPNYYQSLLAALMSDNNSLCHPSMIFRSFDFLLRGMIKNKVAKEVNQRNIYSILKRVQCIKSGDYLNRDNGNIIWDYDNVDIFWNSNRDNFISEVMLNEKLCLLIVLIRTYIELMYFRLYDISQNIHGLYGIGNYNLLLYEFKHLNTLPYAGMTDVLPYSEVRIGVIYTQNVNLDIDIYNHVVQKGKNLKSEIISFILFIDNKLASILELDEILIIFQNAILKRYFLMSTLNNKQIIDLYIKCIVYKIQLLAGNPIFSLHDINYKIPSNIFKNQELLIQPHMITKLIQLIF